MRSLRQRLSLALTLAMGALLTMCGLVAYPTLRSVLMDEFDYALLAKARALTAPTTPGGQGFSLRFTEFPPPEFQPGPRAEYFEVRAEDGTVVGRSASLASTALPISAVSSDQPVFFDVSLPNGRTGRAVAIGLALDGEATGAGSRAYQFVFARDTGRLRQVQRATQAGLLGVGLLMLMASAGLARAVTHAGLRPVAALAEQVTSIEANSLTRRLPVENAPAELQPVINQLNALLDRLHGAFERERRFSANVAHELLTPIAEMRALAENAVRWPADPDATAQFATDVLDTAHQMERLVTTLLALACSQRGDAKSILEPVNLIELLRKLRDQYATRMNSRRLACEWTLPKDATIQTDRTMAESIFTNLVDNAAEYTIPGGKFQCHMMEVAGGWVISFRNSSSRLRPADLDQIFDPLWRKDSARSDRAHAGLGLALVKALGAQLGWQVVVEMLQPDVFQATLRIPNKPIELRANALRHKDTVS